MHLLLVSQVLSRGESKSWGDDTLDGWIVGVVHEQHDTVHGSVDLELLLEETRGLQVDTHSSEDDSEVLLGVILHVLALDEGSLTADLGTDLVVRKTGGREERDLLTSGNGGHGIDGRDAGLDHFLGVDPLIRVDWLTLQSKRRKC